MSLQVYQSIGGELRPIEAGLALEDSLARAVLISLYTDARTSPPGPLSANGEGVEERGWWADEFLGRPIGSRLWTLQRSKATAQTLAQAKQFAEDALAWLIEDKLALSVSVTVFRPRPDWLGWAIAIRRPQSPDGAGQQDYAFETRLLPA